MMKTANYLAVTLLVFCTRIVGKGLLWGKGLRDAFVLASYGLPVGERAAVACAYRVDAQLRGSRGGRGSAAAPSR